MRTQTIIISDGMPNSRPEKQTWQQKIKSIQAARQAKRMSKLMANISKGKLPRKYKRYLAKVQEMRLSAYANGAGYQGYWSEYANYLKMSMRQSI